MTKISQREIRRRVETGRKSGAILTVAEWYRAGHFATIQAAEGAFVLAYQQGLEGMGASVQDWMGLNDLEFNEWMATGRLPHSQ